MLAALNIFFLVFHTSLIVFNVFGWMWARTRRLNLYTQLATLFSWVVMGAWYGWGYCLCTDVHWDIRERMGITGDPNTYIGFLIKEVTGLEASDDFVFWLGLGVFSASFVASLALNIRDLRRLRAAQARP